MIVLPGTNTSVAVSFDDAVMVFDGAQRRTIMALYGIAVSRPQLERPATGQRSWSLPLPVTFDANHGPMLRWGTNGVVLRESRDYGAPAPGIDLFRVNLNQ